MKIRCFFGFHDWKYSDYKIIGENGDGDLINRPHRRVCRCCGLSEIWCWHPHDDIPVPVLSWVDAKSVYRDVKRE
jgi:hypothetical protein